MIWTGKRFGSVVVTGQPIVRLFGKGRATYYDCLCDCGREFSAQISNLKKYSQECRCNRISASKIGQAGSHHPYYKIWSAMIERCLSPNHRSYKNYGGRGISVCSRWLKGVGAKGGLDCFIIDMGVKPFPQATIEREDNSKNYGPDNCVWADRKKQSRNRRGLHILEFQGRSQPMSAWCEELGLPYYTIARRLNHYRWSPERALTEPIRK